MSFNNETNIDYEKYNNNNSEFIDISNMEYIQELGKGNFGTVSLMINNITDKPIVMKKFIKIKTNSTYINELFILKRINTICNKYLLCYIGYFEDNTYFYIYFEYLPNYITLDKAIKSNVLHKNINVLINTVYNILDGVKLLHKYHIAHLDLKPSNIMINVDTGDIKIIDYNVSCYYIQCLRLQSITGTYPYMSPKYFFSNSFNFTICKHNDVIALDIILWELISNNNRYDIWSILENSKDINLYMKNYNKNVNLNYIDEYINLIYNQIGIDIKYNEDKKNIKYNKITDDNINIDLIENNIIKYDQIIQNYVKNIEDYN